MGVAVIGSGNCSGGGTSANGGYRPWGPSGEDCIEVVAGVVDDDAEGVRADAGVKVKGILVTICCVRADCVEAGEGRDCLIEPLATTGEGSVAAGAMLDFETSKPTIPGVGIGASWSGLWSVREKPYHDSTV